MNESIWDLIHLIESACVKDDLGNLDAEALEGLVLEVYMSLTDLVR